MIENKLKELIIQRYGSLRHFSNIIDIPYTTIDSIFKRGFRNANVINVIKICKKLDIDLDELIVNENIVFKDDIIKTNLILDEKHKLDIMIQDKSKELTEDGKKALINIIDNLSSIDNK